MVKRAKTTTVDGMAEEIDNLVAEQAADDGGAIKSPPGWPKNQPDATPASRGHGGFAKDQLVAFVERIERLNEEKSALAADIAEVFSEAKGTGFDTKIIRKVISLRKLNTADRQEQEAILDLYMSALGMEWD